MEGRSIKNIIENISADGLDYVIKSSNLVEYLLPFKEYQERYKKIIKS